MRCARLRSWRFAISWYGTWCSFTGRRIGKDCGVVDGDGDAWILREVYRGTFEVP